MTKFEGLPPISERAADHVVGELLEAQQDLEARHREQDLLLDLLEAAMRALEEARAKHGRALNRLHTTNALDYCSPEMRLLLESQQAKYSTEHDGLK